MQVVQLDFKGNSLVFLPWLTGRRVSVVRTEFFLMETRNNFMQRGYLTKLCLYYANERVVKILHAFLLRLVAQICFKVLLQIEFSQRETKLKMDRIISK